MLFDVQAALTEILNDAPEAAIPAISTIPPHRLAGKAGIAVVPEEIPAPADVLPFPPQPSASVFACHEPCDFPHGQCRVTGRPRTWTGRVVCLDEWRTLSAWDRHGSTGKFWDGITRQWKEPG